MVISYKFTYVKKNDFFSVLSVDYCGQAMMRDATGYIK